VKHLNILLAAVLAVGVTAAQADQHESPVYGGLSLGVTSLDDGKLGSLVNLDDSDETFSLFVGYKFNENFAVEGGWSELGDYTYDGGNLEVEAFTFDLVGILPVDEQISVFAKAGVARVDYDAASKDTQTALSFGLGADYDFGNNISLQGEWTRINESSAPIDMFGANIVFGF